MPGDSHHLRLVPNKVGPRNVSHTFPGTFCSFMDSPAEGSSWNPPLVECSPVSQTDALLLCGVVVFSPGLEGLLLHRGLGADHHGVSSLRRDVLHLSPQDFSIPCHLETAFLLLLIIQDLSMKLLSVGCAGK